MATLIPNLNYYSSEEARERYNIMKLKVKDMQNRIDTLTTLLHDKQDNSASYTHTIEHLKQMVTNLERKEHILPPKIPLIKNTIYSQNQTVIPKKEYQDDTSQWYGKYMSAAVMGFPIKKGYTYIVTAKVTKDDVFFLSSKSSDLTNYIGNQKVFITLKDNDNKFIKFVGKQINHHGDEHLRLEFQSMVNNNIFLVPSNYDYIHDLTVYECHYDKNNPTFDQLSAIPIPEPNGSDANGKENPVVFSFINTIKEQLKQHQIDVPKVWHSEDANGNINYRFTAYVVQPKRTFIQAVNKLNGHNGMTRLNATKDCWVELDADNNLVVKYRGNDRMFSYNPTKDDINSKDWIVENNRPFNPNTGSDTFDDSSDTDNFGYGTDGGPYVDQFGLHNGSSIDGNNTDTDGED